MGDFGLAIEMVDLGVDASGLALPANTRCNFGARRPYELFGGRGVVEFDRDAVLMEAARLAAPQPRVGAAAG